MHWRSEGRPWTLVFMLMETMWIFHGSFSQKWLSPCTNPLYYKNNVPRFAFRMIRLLVGMCGVKTETLAVVPEFSLFTGMSKVSEIFTQFFCENCLFCPDFSEFLELQKYGKCSDCYRLSYLRHILFLMHCFACFDETIDSIGGISHGKVIIQ